MSIVEGLHLPLRGVHIVEFEGIGPGPLAARMPADTGADVTTIARPGPAVVTERLAGTGDNPLRRGKRVVQIDLKTPEGVARALGLVADAAGALGLAFGIACALIDARVSGRGRVVDAAIVDIVAMLGTLVQWIRASGQIDAEEASPFHDSPFYDAYECADGGFITVAAVEPQFYALLLAKLELVNVDPGSQYDKATWPELKARITALFRSRPRAAWCALLEGSDVCFAPVLSLAEAAQHPPNTARGTYRHLAPGPIEVAAAPRFMTLTPSQQGTTT